MKKDTVHIRAAMGIRISALLSLITLWIALSFSELGKQPGFFRTSRLTIELMLPNHIQSWQLWYAENPLAPFLVFVLTAAPFLLLLIFVCLRFDIFDWFLTHLPSASSDAQTADRDPKQSKSPIFKAPGKASRTAAPSINADEKLAKLDALKSLYSEKDPFAVDRGVRVQVLSGDPKSRTDYILEWRPEPGAATGRLVATIPLNAQRELLLLWEPHGVPQIVGIKDLNENTSEDEHAWVEKQFPLTEGEPLILKRQNNQSIVERYAITWLGGRSK